MRLIDADALIENCSWDADTRVGYVQVVDVGDIENAPTIDPVKHGVWVGEGDGYADGYMVYDQWYCDQCCHHEENDDPDLLPNYCPNCGAKMSVPKNADE